MIYLLYKEIKYQYLYIIMFDNNKNFFSDFDPLINLKTIGTKLEDFEEIPCLEKEYTIILKEHLDYYEKMKSKLDHKFYTIKKIDKNSYYFNKINFIRETKILINLNHDNIVKFYGYFEDKENISKFQQIHQKKSRSKEIDEGKGYKEVFCLVFECFSNNDLEIFFKTFKNKIILNLLNKILS